MHEIHTVRTGPNHALHATLTVLTCGLWGIVWLILSIANPQKTAVVAPAPLPPGVYPTHDGQTRYWDGERWQ
ncbi:MAG TPA: hypothetical protein VJ816_09915 [Gemmatimonadales bacterium]|nr:hypothetical protein [Gemmatimonadales bacterium]